MGIPKFYRWISQRYPQINESVVPPTAGGPQFDNLYLDTNGLIHMATHGNHDGLVGNFDEQKCYEQIIEMIDHIFCTVSPKKLLFIAIDGPAPRAKMNQQRERRFRSAMDAENDKKAAIERGETVPDKIFDTNAITPGTEFMMRLDAILQHYLVEKVNTDPNWQRIKVVYSSCQVPGEGEHKVMEYLRNETAQPGYDPSTRHCCLGLDADLIMLALTCHQPNFSLLREEQVFDKTNTNKSMREINWTYLHLSIFRDYLEIEMNKNLQGCDIERLIDDFILLAYTIGNDFLPSLPSIAIVNKSFEEIFNIYGRVQPAFVDDGYLNNCGEINFENLCMFMSELATFEETTFEKKISNEAQGKKGMRRMDFDEINGASMMLDDEDEIFRMDEQYIVSNYSKMKFTSHSELRQKYYLIKFHVDINEDPGFPDRLAKIYVKSLVWVLSYYYLGVVDWNFYYPYHYAPLVSDIARVDFNDLDLTFNTELPASLPFTQLLCVLPPASAPLLPPEFAELMYCDELKDMYPERFAIDMDGARRTWEGVVLLPYLDVDLLLEKIGQIDTDSMDPNVLLGNTHHVSKAYVYDPTLDENEIIEAPAGMPWRCEIVNHSCIVQDFFPTPIPDVVSEYVREFKNHPYLEGVSFKPIYDVPVHIGFPTMGRGWEYTHEWKSNVVSIFKFTSRDPTIILTPPKSDFAEYINNRLDFYTNVDFQTAMYHAKSETNNLLGCLVWTNWPNFRPSIIKSIQTHQFKISYDETTGKVHMNKGNESFNSRCNRVSAFMLKNRGLSMDFKYLIEVAYVHSFDPLVVRETVCLPAEYIFRSLPENVLVSGSDFYRDVLELHPIEAALKKGTVALPNKKKREGDFKISPNAIAIVTDDFPDDEVRLGQVFRVDHQHSDMTVTGHVFDLPFSLPYYEPGNVWDRIAENNAIPILEYALGMQTIISKSGMQPSTVFKLVGDNKWPGFGPFGFCFKTHYNDYIPGYSRVYADGERIFYKYTERVLQLLQDFRLQFPEVVNYLDGNSKARTLPQFKVEHVFGSKSKANNKKREELKMFFRTFHAGVERLRFTRQRNSPEEEAALVELLPVVRGSSAAEFYNGMSEGQLHSLINDVRETETNVSKTLLCCNSRQVTLPQNRLLFPDQPLVSSFRDFEYIHRIPKIGDVVIQLENSGPVPIGARGVIMYVENRGVAGYSPNSFETRFLRSIEDALQNTNGNTHHNKAMAKDVREVTSNKKSVMSSTDCFKVQILWEEVWSGTSIAFGAGTQRCTLQDIETVFNTSSPGIYRRIQTVGRPQLIGQFSEVNKGHNPVQPQQQNQQQGKKKRRNNKKKRDQVSREKIDIIDSLFVGVHATTGSGAKNEAPVEQEPKDLPFKVVKVEEPSQPLNIELQQATVKKVNKKKKRKKIQMTMEPVAEKRPKKKTTVQTGQQTGRLANPGLLPANLAFASGPGPVRAPFEDHDTKKIRRKTKRNRQKRQSGESH
ncbi:hypothetical protein PCE1_003485 [Barthelona sp. PCE]